MKTRLLLFIPALTLGMFLNGCNAHSQNLPDKQIVTAFKAKYPNAKKTEWESKQGFYVAEFHNDNIESEAWFDNKGKWTLTKNELRYNMLPAEIRNNLEKTDYNNWKKDDITKIERPNVLPIYIIEVEKAGQETNLYYTENGQLVKTMNDLIVPSSGQVLVGGQPIGVASKRIISYLPERTYLDKTMRVAEAIKFFTEFYSDFDVKKAQKLVENLNLNLDQKISTMSKGMQEKLQLILVMSRKAKLYILDEPLGGIDPATRDYILDTILSNFADGASMIISTHLIADIERILDEVIFIDQGKILLTADADTLRTKHHASIDEIFRQKFNHESKIS